MSISNRQYHELVATIEQIGQRLNDHIEQARIKTEEDIYNSLPTTVQAEMVEEKFNELLEKMEEILK